MVRLPDFYVLGFMRCGTSTMWKLLNQHPQIIPPKEDGKLIKEIHWLSNEEKSKDLIGYRKLFPIKKPGELTYDCSHSYSYSKTVPEIIKKMTPRAKFIVLLRDPVERAWSEHWIEDNENAKKEKIFLNSTAVKRGCYDIHIKRWLKYFDRDQFLFLKAETFFDSPELTMNVIFEFLKLKRFNIKPEIWDAAESKIKKYGEKPSVPNNIAEKLKKYYSTKREFKW
jgi:hypothetical protein